MFCKSIFEAIDIIGAQKFENDVIDVKLNDDTINFLINDLNHQFDGLITTGVIGLKLKKTDLTSIGDYVNLEFLKVLKKTTQIYLTRLASNWEEDLKQHSHPSLDKCPNLRIKNKYKKMGAASFNLADIAFSWNFSKKIKITGYSSEEEVNVCGKPEDLKQFLNILRQEARAAEREPRSLSRIICTQIFSDLSTYQKDERYKFLPKELLEKINKESIFYLTEK